MLQQLISATRTLLLHKRRPCRFPFPFSVLVPLLFLTLLINVQRGLCGSSLLSWYHLLSWDCRSCETTKPLHHPQFMVSVSVRVSVGSQSSALCSLVSCFRSKRPRGSCATFVEARILIHVISLCFAVIIGLPAATPKEYMNSASFALGNFSNGLSSSDLVLCLISPP